MGGKMGHVQPFKNYLFTFIGLLILTVVTVWISKFDFGMGNLWVAMAVAFCKATLVVLFFMHGKYEGKITWAFIYYPFGLLAILLGAVYLDYYTGKSRTDEANYFVNREANADGSKKPESLTLSHGDHGSDHGAAGDHGDDHGATDSHGDDHAAPAQEGDGHGEDGGQGEEHSEEGEHGNEGDH